MTATDTIGDEGARLNALRDVGLLDAEPDPALERLTRLAGAVLDVPISLVSLVVDTAAREVSVDGESIRVPAREFELLCTLAADPTRVFTKQELLKQIWGYEDPHSTRTLDSHACRLRRRLAEGGRPGLVRAVWGVGYRLTA